MSEIDMLRKNVFDNLQEIERLNNIINELEKYAQELFDNPSWASCGARCILEKLKELKESGNNE